MNHGIFNRENREPHENKRRENTEVLQAQPIRLTTKNAFIIFGDFRAFRG
jgi:hypothetical protein